jgi:hypothetical protein
MCVHAKARAYVHARGVWRVEREGGREGEREGGRGGEGGREGREGEKEREREGQRKMGEVKREEEGDS